MIEKSTFINHSPCQTFPLYSTLKGTMQVIVFDYTKLLMYAFMTSTVIRYNLEK